MSTILMMKTMKTNMSFFLHRTTHTTRIIRVGAISCQQIHALPVPGKLAPRLQRISWNSCAQQGQVSGPRHLLSVLLDDAGLS